MTAIFSWVEFTNATTSGVATNLNLGSANSRNLAPSTYPITAGHYSYSKYIAGLFTGTFTRINNIQFYMSASGSGYVTGENLLTSATDGTYSGTDDVTKVVPTTKLDGYADNAMPTSDPGTANVGIGGSLSGSLSSPGYSDFIVLQGSYKNTAPSGAVQQKQFTLQFDDI